MYKVTINYFKKNGDQEQKTITRQSLTAIIKAVKSFEEKNEIYSIPGVTHNLVDNEYINGLGWK